MASIEPYNVPVDKLYALAELKPNNEEKAWVSPVQVKWLTNVERITSPDGKISYRGNCFWPKDENKLNNWLSSMKKKPKGPSDDDWIMYEKSRLLKFFASLRGAKENLNKAENYSDMSESDSSSRKRKRNNVNRYQSLPTSGFAGTKQIKANGSTHPRLADSDSDAEELPQLNLPGLNQLQHAANKQSSSINGIVSTGQLSVSGSKSVSVPPDNQIRYSSPIATSATGSVPSAPDQAGTNNILKPSTLQTQLKSSFQSLSKKDGHDKQRTCFENPAESLSIAKFSHGVGSNTTSLRNGPRSDNIFSIHRSNNSTNLTPPVLFAKSGGSENSSCVQTPNVNSSPSGIPQINHSHQITLMNQRGTDSITAEVTSPDRSASPVFSESGTSAQNAFLNDGMDDEVHESTQGGSVDKLHENNDLSRRSTNDRNPTTKTDNNGNISHSGLPNNDNKDDSAAPGSPSTCKGNCVPLNVFRREMTVQRNRMDKMHLVLTKIFNCVAPALNLREGSDFEGGVPCVPINSWIVLAEWSDHLADHDNFTHVVNMLLDFGSSYDARDAIFNLCEYFLTNKMACLFNLKGVNKGNARWNKKKFLNTCLYNIIRAILSEKKKRQTAVQKVFDFNDDIYHCALSSWLKDSPKRFLVELKAQGAVDKDATQFPVRLLDIDEESEEED